MPRGVYDRKKKRTAKKVQAWSFATTVPTEGIDYILRKAEFDELADAVCELFEPGVKADILQHIIQGRIDRMVYPPEQLLTELGERIQSFAPQPETENPENAETGSDAA